MTSSSLGNRWIPLAGAALLVLATAQSGGDSPTTTAASVILLLLAGALAIVGARGRTMLSAPGNAVIGAVSGALTIPAAISLADRLAPESVVAQVAFGVSLALVTAFVVAAPYSDGSDRRGTRVVTVIFVLVVTGVSVVALGAVGRRIDVHVFLTQGVDALLHGSNPYTAVFPNIYTPQESVAYYGEGAVAGDHLAYGFPYLPGTLLGAVPGYLLGDVRLSGLLLLAVLAVLVVLTGADVRGRLVAATLVTAPTIMAGVTGSWTEPMQVALLGFVFIALKRRRLMAAAILLGLALATKQYLVVVLPALWLLRGTFGRRQWLAMIGSALAVTVPFFLADPGAFWRAVVEWQLIQPFRPDSVSLLAMSVNQLGWPPAAIFGLLPIVAGLGIASVLAWRLLPGTAAFLLTVGVALLATVLLSKQAFINYYVFVGGCLLLAAWAAGDQDPLFRSRSLPGGVAEVGDVGRESRVHP